ncbi:MAG: DUF2807 domain-containing protein [Hyphomonas sp.]|nr:DUF2807 domain-containing protein [Hyphomonas sp.]
MKTPILASAAIGAALCLSAFAGEQKSFSNTGFDELDVAAGLEVTYRAGDSYSVVAEILKGDADDLRITQDGTRLKISRKTTSGWGNRFRAKVTVTSPDLRGIDASSGSSISATGVDADDFGLKVSSGASAEISGTCGNLSVKVSSGGNADARDLKCESVTAKASSGGSADVYASEAATSNASSGGSVDVWGKPKQQDANRSMSGGNTDFHN